MKITIEPETDEDRELRPETVELEGVETFAIIGALREDDTSKPIQQIHSVNPLGVPQLIGQLNIAAKMLQMQLLAPRPVKAPQIAMPMGPMGPNGPGGLPGPMMGPRFKMD